MGVRFNRRLLMATKALQELLGQLLDGVSAIQ
jgi:hypothetical protein